MLQLLDKSYDSACKNMLGEEVWSRPEVIYGGWRRAVEERKGKMGEFGAGRGEKENDCYKDRNGCRRREKGMQGRLTMIMEGLKKRLSNSLQTQHPCHPRTNEIRQYTCNRS